MIGFERNEIGQQNRNRLNVFEFASIEIIFLLPPLVEHQNRLEEATKKKLSVSLRSSEEQTNLSYPFCQGLFFVEKKRNIDGLVVGFVHFERKTRTLIIGLIDCSQRFTHRSRRVHRIESLHHYIQSVIAGKRNWQTRIFAVIGYGRTLAHSARFARSLCSILFKRNLQGGGGAQTLPRDGD